MSFDFNIQSISNHNIIKSGSILRLIPWPLTHWRFERDTKCTATCKKQIGINDYTMMSQDRTCSPVQRQPVCQTDSFYPGCKNLRTRVVGQAGVMRDWYDARGSDYNCTYYELNSYEEIEISEKKDPFGRGEGT